MSARLRYSVSMIVVYAIIWAVLTGGSSDSLAIGIPTILLAAIVSACLYEPSIIRWRLLALFRFIPYFLWHSIKGGFAVAKLALRKSPDFTSTVIKFNTRLPDHGSQVFMSSIASLLPGTLIMDIQGDQLLVHVIDASMNIQDDLNHLETEIANLLGIELEARVDGNE